MLGSISAPTDNWVLFAAVPPAGAQSGETGAASLSNAGTVAADTSACSPVTGGASSPLPGDTNIWLMMVGGGPTAASGTNNSAGSGPLLAVLLSLMSTLTDITAAAIDNSGTAAAIDNSGTAAAIDSSGTAAAIDSGGTAAAIDSSGTAAAIDNSGTAAAIDSSGTAAAIDSGGTTVAIDNGGSLGSVLLQDLNAIVSDLEAMAADFGTSAAVSGMQSPSGPGSAGENTVTNANSASAADRGWHDRGWDDRGSDVRGWGDRGWGDRGGSDRGWTGEASGNGVAGGWQQFLAAYATGNQSASNVSPAAASNVSSGSDGSPASASPSVGG